MLQTLTMGSSGDQRSTINLTGRKLAGVYRIEERIATGGYGDIYLATHITLRHKLAIKVLLPHVAAIPVARERFKREARTILQLDHPHIVKLIDFRMSDPRAEGRPFLVMPWLEGQTLSEALRHGQPLDLVTAVAVVQQCGEALAYAHAFSSTDCPEGVVHRDVSPSNIFLVQRSGLVDARLLDFGIAKITGLTPITCGPLGTPPYMSPEHWQSPESVDGQADIYSLAAVLYHSLTGVTPFAGSEPQELARHVLHESPPSLRSQNPSIPRCLERVVMRGMAKRKALRHATMREFLDDLGKAQDEVNYGEAGTMLLDPPVIEDQPAPQVLVEPVVDPEKHAFDSTIEQDDTALFLRATRPHWWIPLQESAVSACVLLLIVTLGLASFHGGAWLVQLLAR